MNNLALRIITVIGKVAVIYNGGIKERKPTA